jgi:2-keto-4-pentenoate hydratase
MKGDSQHGSAPQSIQDIARQFVAAREQRRPLDGFPGELPENLEQAYHCQDAALALWPDRVGGWKVGRIPPAVERRFQCDRLAGPIFRQTIHMAAPGDCPIMPIFAGGFAAVEAEFVAVIGDDAPPQQLHWSLDEAADMIVDLRIGLEIASSPLASINDIGPLAVVSDFGNNAGLIVGPTIRDWQTRSLESLCCEAFVDERSVGRGGAFQLSGGFLRSVQFMLELAARRGHPLQSGALIATGQTTGIHDVLIGQQARLDFAEDGELHCRFAAAAP